MPRRREDERAPLDPCRFLHAASHRRRRRVRRVEFRLRERRHSTSSPRSGRPAGHIEGLSLRLYNPQSRQWSLNFSNSRDGLLTPPVFGGFAGGRGEFFGQDTLNGQAILVRFVISEITPNSCRFEQAFSVDGGRNWEVNWIAVDTRLPDRAATP